MTAFSSFQEFVQSLSLDQAKYLLKLWKVNRNDASARSDMLGAGIWQKMIEATEERILYLDNQ